MVIETKRYPEDAVPPFGLAPKVVELKPWYKKINPLWWIGNDEGVDPSYNPKWSEWKRKLYWYVFRNPFWNFKKYVIGVYDRHSLVTGPHPVFWSTWTELGGKPLEGDPDQTPLPISGWKISWLRPQSGFYPPLPFFCWSKGNQVFYIGWHPCGGTAGIKTNGLLPITGLIIFLLLVASPIVYFWWF